MALEMFFDTVRARLIDMQAQAASQERRWAAAGVPGTALAFKTCRMSSLHIATLFMSRYTTQLEAGTIDNCKGFER